MDETKLPPQIKGQQDHDPVEVDAKDNNTRLMDLGYASLLDGEVQRAIDYYKQALQTSTLEAFPAEWATIQIILGVAYSQLLTGDRQANLQQAISFFQAASQVYTSEAFPAEWTLIEKNLKAAYDELLGEKDRSV